MTMLTASLLETSAPEARRERPVYQTLIVLAAALFLFMPFITTFNEFLTRVVMRLGLDTLLRAWIVPLEARMMAVLILPLGIGVQLTPDMIHLHGPGRTISVFISWNCVGWQSFILLVVTLLAGLPGPYTRASKFQVMLIGVLGTFLFNLLRLVSVVLVAYFFGQLPATLYHDYGGTLLLLLWLFTFWSFAYNSVLEPLPETQDEVETQVEAQVESQP